MAGSRLSGIVRRNLVVGTRLPGAAGASTAAVHAPAVVSSARVAAMLGGMNAQLLVATGTYHVARPVQRAHLSSTASNNKNLDKDIKIAQLKIKIGSLNDSIFLGAYRLHHLVLATLNHAEKKELGSKVGASAVNNVFCKKIEHSRPIIYHLRDVDAISRENFISKNVTEFIEVMRDTLNNPQVQQYMSAYDTSDFVSGFSRAAHKDAFNFAKEQFELLSSNQKEVDTFTKELHKLTRVRAQAAPHTHKPAGGKIYNEIKVILSRYSVIAKAQSDFSVPTPDSAVAQNQRDENVRLKVWKADSAEMVKKILRNPSLVGADPNIFKKLSKLILGDGCAEIVAALRCQAARLEKQSVAFNYPGYFDLLGTDPILTNDHRGYPGQDYEAAVIATKLAFLPRSGDGKLIVDVNVDGRTVQKEVPYKEVIRDLVASYYTGKSDTDQQRAKKFEQNIVGNFDEILGLEKRYNAQLESMVFAGREDKGAHSAAVVAGQAGQVRGRR